MIKIKITPEIKEKLAKTWEQEALKAVDGITEGYKEELNQIKDVSFLWAEAQLNSEDPKTKESYEVTVQLWLSIYSKQKSKVIINRLQAGLSASIPLILKIIGICF